MAERWRPIYGEEELSRYIRDISRRNFLEESFYEWRSTAQLGREHGGLCQGDIVQLFADVPVLFSDGQPSAREHPSGRWLVIGNTCDFERVLSEAEYTQVVPIEDLGPVALMSDLASLRSFSHYRQFYLPDWRVGQPPRCWVADFTLPVPLHKASFPAAVELQARMTLAAWTLLNACLVRFLARSDGRNG